MANLNLKIKSDAGPGSFVYVYDCVCGGKPTTEITVTAGTDDEALSLAQDQCSAYCGEGPTDSRINIAGTPAPVASRINVAGTSTPETSRTNTA